MPPVLEMRKSLTEFLSAVTGESLHVTECKPCRKFDLFKFIIITKTKETLFFALCLQKRTS